jgi:hypothetical protein
MSYAATPDNALRLGDVVSGFVIGACHLRTPTLVPQDHHVTVTYPRFAAVLTPCCSVGDGCILLAPLVGIRPKFFGNSYLAEDLTRINRPMAPQQAVSPDVWDKLGTEERQRRLDQAHDESYAFGELFVYAPDERLPRYSVKWAGKELVGVGHYMIDFRQMHRVECERVISTKDVPLDTKVLQLSVPTRTELRDKLAKFFGRQALEDMV